MTDTTHDDRTARTLSEMSHTNPNTGKAFGDTQTYERGRTVAADGGEREPRRTRSDGGKRESEDDEDVETMKDVDHTPRKDSEGVNHVYDTGSPRNDEDE